MNETKAFSNTGTVRLALYDAAIPFSSRAFFDTGNTDQLNYTVSENVVELPDARDPAGGIDASMRRVQSAGGTLNLRHTSPETLALALWGKSSDVAATPITGEVHVLRAGRFVPADHLINTAVAPVIKKGATVVDAGDYTVEESGGGIIFNATITTGTVADGDAIAFDYTPVLQFDIDALVQAAPLVSIHCVGQNAYDGKACSDTIYKARIGAVKQFDRINNGQFGALALEFTIERDPTITGTDKSKYYKHSEAK